MTTMTTNAATTAPETQTVEPAVITVTISNVCQCLLCATCGVIFDEATSGPDVCPECDTDEDVTFGDCGGTCYDDAVAALGEAVQTWTENNPSVDNEWVITGIGMGWRHRSGTKHVDLTRACLSEAISVNSEWTQTWTIETDPGGCLTASQSHHDAMGEGYSVAPLR